MIAIHLDKALVISTLADSKPEFVSLASLSWWGKSIYLPKSSSYDMVLVPKRADMMNPYSELTHFEAHRVMHEVQNPKRPYGATELLTTSGKMVRVGLYMSEESLHVAEAIPVIKGETPVAAVRRFNKENAKTTGFRALDERRPVDFRALNDVLDANVLAEKARAGVAVNKERPAFNASGVSGNGERGQYIDFATAAAKVRRCKLGLGPES